MTSVPSRVLLLILGACTALALAEALASWVLPSRPCAGRVPFWRPDRTVGWVLTPGRRGEASVCGGDQHEVARHRIEVNDLGQRDRPRHYRRTPGRRRVLVLGDSFVEALQVDLEDTFPARLERTLGVEMLNAGVSGYSTDNELRAFLRAGRRYHPDAVLLLLHVGNDVLENGALLYLENPHGLPPKPWLRARAATGTLATCLSVHRAIAGIAAGLGPFAWEHSRLIRMGLIGGQAAIVSALCRRATGPAVIEGVPELLGVYGEPRTPAWRQAWSETESLLAHLARRVRATGATFGVALGPAGFEYDPRLRWYERLEPGTRGRAWDFDYPYRRLGRLLSDQGIPWTSLVPALRAHDDATGDSGTYEWDSHWTAGGHAVVADALAPFVAGLLPPGP